MKHLYPFYLKVLFCILAGSTLEAMALAVERAAVVLICMSQKYKDSPNCRTGEHSNWLNVLVFFPLCI